MEKWRSALIAVLVAVPAGVAGGFAAQAYQEHQYDEARAAYASWEAARPPAVPEQLAEALDDLAEDHVTVGADVAGQVPAADLETARATLAAADVPTYLMFVREPHSGDVGYSVDGVLRLMEEEVAKPAYLAVLTTQGDTRTRTVDLEKPHLDYHVGRGRPGTAVQAVATALVESPPEPVQEIPAYEAYDSWGGRGGGAAMGLLFGAGVVAPLAFAADWVWRRRRTSAMPMPKKDKTRGRYLP